MGRDNGRRPPSKLAAGGARRAHGCAVRARPGGGARLGVHVTAIQTPSSAIRRTRQPHSNAALYTLYGEPRIKYTGRCRNGCSVKGRCSPGCGGAAWLDDLRWTGRARLRGGRVDSVCCCSRVQRARVTRGVRLAVPPSFTRSTNLRHPPASIYLFTVGAAISRAISRGHLLARCRRGSRVRVAGDAAPRRAREPLPHV